MSTFTARYPGTCAGCDGHISPGDLVRFGYDDALRHDICPDPVEVEREVCADCFTEQSVTGACACEDGAA